VGGMEEEIEENDSAQFLCKFVSIILHGLITNSFCYSNYKKKGLFADFFRACL
jgi:hypothetical protein